jgi:hypothetical protein
MIKVTGSLQKSTEIMKLSNALIKLPQISQTMREMSMEMTKVRRRECVPPPGGLYIFHNRQGSWRKC